jgi:chromosomal replication initiator protein
MVEEFLALGRKASEADSPPPTVDCILSATAEVFSVPKADLVGRKRQHRIKDARKAGMILARQLTGASLTEIGQAFGKRSHATVLQAIRGGEEFLQSTETLKARCRELRGRYPHAHQQQLLG